MATSLRDFQNTIDGIHARELAKQRASAAAAAQAMDKEKDKKQTAKAAKDAPEIRPPEDKSEALRLEELTELQVRGIGISTRHLRNAHTRRS